MVLFRSFLFYSCISLTALFAALFGAFCFVVHHQSVNFSALEHYNPGSPTILLDDRGVEWARFQLDRREPVPFEQMPIHLIQAFIAAEDWAFFNHAGISFKGIVRSMAVNIYNGRIVQGASTITQQLVKLLFFDGQKTFKRKIKEQLFAVLIEYQYTKQQIMQTYLNHVYFGCGIYGVQAASQRFWGKNVSALTLEESAALAAVVRSPRSYCPLLCPLSCARRRNLIIRSMAKLGFVPPQQAEAAVKVPLTVNDRNDQLIAPHYKEVIRIFLEDLMGRDAVYKDGLVVQTTLSVPIQTQAQAAFDTQVASLRKSWLPNVDGALITMDAKTGGIRAMIGGYDFVHSKFNRALQAKRQMGSTFKPLVYAAAINQGACFADTEIDEPFTLEQDGQIWQPNNWHNRFDGQMTLAYALSNSNNIVTIKRFLRVGAQAVIDLARRCGIQGPLNPYPALALGCVDVTPAEVAGALNIFAADGVWVKPHTITWIKDRWGNKIYKHKPETERVLPSRVAGQVAKVLGLGMERVKRYMPAHQWIDGQAIGKTGTSDFRTCWFVGSTPELTTAIYIGRDDNQIMGKGVFPLRTAFPIWISLHHKIPLKKNKFEFDPSLRDITVDERTGKLLRAADAAHQPGAITILV